LWQINTREKADYERERTPAETAADYAVHFADGFFVPCPCCGKEVESPDNGFTSEKEAMEWALGACDCAGAKAWQQQRPALRMDSPCVAGKMKAGRCGHTAYTARCTGSACSAYHPELYAPDLYARAFDLYAKRKADEKEWAEFHPAATIMRYCRQLPAPVPYWEPPTYKTGSCCFCGQLRVLPFAAPTQEEADQYATDKCDCEIGKARRRRRGERENIAGLFAEFEPDTLRLLGTIADMVRNDYIKGGTAIKLAENVTAKFKVKDGTVIVTRSEKNEHQHSL
jgi:hypothetical protein